MNFQLNPEVFLDECTIQLETIQDQLLGVLEGTSDSNTINSIFRAVHTIKGSASIYHYDIISSLSHKLEDLLDFYRSNNLLLNQQTATSLLDVKDILEHLTSIYVEHRSIDENTLTSIEFIEKQLQKELLLASYKLKKQSYQEQIETSCSISVLQPNQKVILIVDDSSMIRNVASKNAEEAGYTILTANDGTQGLEVLQKNDVDLIFSDVNMPLMDGLSMVKQIKSNPKYEFTPIVMMTTEKDPDLKAQGKEYGVKAWLVKPFNKDKFLMVIDKILN